MSLVEVIKGDIKEHCIACLEKSEIMHNLTKNIEKWELFINMFHVELNNFREYPHFLCGACDINLNITYSFHQRVRKTLALLEEYNKNLQVPHSDEDRVEEENHDNEDVQTKVNSVKDNSVLEVSSDEVDRVIEEFKNRFVKNKVCVICGFIALNRRSISSHVAIFHKDIKHKWCLECNKIFENYEEHKESHSSRCQCPFCKREITVPHYVEHLQSHLGTFQCKECNKVFKSAAWLAKHSRIHRDEKPYVCPNCSRGFIQLSSLRYHLSTHGKFCCDSCKKHYRTAKDLKKHKCTSDSTLVTKEIWVTPGEQNETEPAETIIIKGVETQTDCDKRVKSLRQHIKKYHSTINEQETAKEIECEFCQKTFSNTYKLKVHTRTHTGQLPYKCKFCDRRALTRSRLKDHERTHTKEKPYICNVCGKGLSQSSALRTHMKQHTGRPEVCNLCSKTFCRKSELKLHLSKHMGEKPFLCTECGRTFAQSSHLSEHMASHSEERPFGCSCCDKRFKTNNLLKEHMKLHLGYKPFRCPTCPYACYKAYRLQQHMKQHASETYENSVPSEILLENSDQIQPCENILPLITPGTINDIMQTD